MQTITAQLDAAFRAAIRDAFGFDADPLVAPAQTDKFGDYQANASMGLAKVVAERTGQKTNPRQVAEQIKAKLDLGEMASEVSIAGPGFLNVRLSPAWLSGQLAAIGSDPRLGVATVAAPLRVIVDYPSLNAAKESHVGHIRPMDIGDAIARVLRFAGHEVIPQNHLGDWGTAFGMLLNHLQSVGGSADAEIASLDAFYKAAKRRFDEEPAFADESRAMVVKLQGGDPTALKLWAKILDETRRHFEQIYARMNLTVPSDAERGESFYNPLLADTVKELKDLGVATLSEGATVVWVEGFEAPLIVQKTGGGFGYAATDLAAVRYRLRELKGQWLVYVTDARQSQHFTQWIAAARKAGWLTSETRIDHVTFGTILGEDGKPLKTKSGENVKLADVLDEAEQRALALVSAKSGDALSDDAKRQVATSVGVGAVKYFDLNKDRTSDYQFNWELMLSLDGNTAPYLQYAYARIQSIKRKTGLAASAASAPITLDSPFELALAKQILRLGEVVESVLRDLKPHVLCLYLYELAGRFSGFYENCPVLQSDGPTRTSRLALCDLTARTIALGLDLLGIEHPDQM
ncbi:MAG TPA: arginine--tRNA ligase [Tepidisphaeraceae bacterium]|nr:arginine--tRNA ligase [Tepidisphaeraceae bacterium]